MCGLAGLWGPPLPSSDVSRNASGAMDAALAAMAARLRHRGPDAQSAWRDDAAGLGLAHARLAILELSPAGAQPMVSASGRFTLVYNGEIYNHQELRADLPGPFRGGCDTETLLAGVEAWGLEETLARAAGMFALALWDRRDRVLTLARDRFGKKPLYHGVLGGTFLFASELKALAVSPAWRESPPTLDLEALDLCCRFACIPSPWSIWREIRSLPPGSLLAIPEARRLDPPAPRRWWRHEDMIVRALAAPFPDMETAREAVRPLLRRAVSQRLQSDVPVGVFLSGGVDSSLVAALVAEQAREAGGPTPVAFTMGSTCAAYDETAPARAVAAHLGLPFQTEAVDEAQALAVVQELPDIFDEPFADASQIPTLLVSRLARRHATALLSGDGGDELFAGYTRHVQAPRLWGRLSRLPLSLRRLLALVPRHGEAPLAWLGDRLLPAASRQTVLRDKIHKLARALAAPSDRAFFHSLLHIWEAAPLHRAGQARSPDVLSLLSRDLPPLSFRQYMQAMDQRFYLPADILTKVDRATMAASVEARCPLLDHRLAEAAWRLPEAALLDGRGGKAILRTILAEYVPPALFLRPKQGFGAPLEHWLRGPLRDWAADLLAPSRLHPALDAAAVTRAWDEHQSCTRNRQYALWAILQFQAWRDRWRP